MPGEGHYDVLDREIGQLVELHKARGDLNLTPLKFTPEMERPSNGPLLTRARCSPTRPASGSSSPTPAITGSSRPASTARKPVTIGSGEEGFDDGGFDKATFNRPQGMCSRRRNPLRGRHREPRDPRRRPQGAEGDDGRGHRHAGQQHPQPGRFRPGQDDPALQPVGRDSDRATTRRSTSPWPGRTRSGSSTWLRGVVSVFAGSGYENIQDGTRRHRPSSPSRAGWRPTARTSSSPIPKSRACG